MPDLGYEFIPYEKYGSRVKKEAEHQAALLVLQFIQGAELCGLAKEIQEEPVAGNDGKAYHSEKYIRFNLNLP